MAGLKCFSHSPPAQVILIDNGSMTLDTGKSLEWLDPAESINRSFDNVSGQFGAGGELCRLAARQLCNSFADLFVNAGFPGRLYTSGPASPDMFQAIQLFGQGIIEPVRRCSRLVLR